MKRTNAHNKLHVYLAILIAFSLPFGKLTPVFIVLLFANWLLEGNLKNKLNLFFKNRLALLFVLFYLIHIVGLFYTKNMNAGLFDIQVKLSILIFPIVLSSKPLNSPNSYSIFIAFLLGLVGASLYMLTRSGYIYTTTRRKTTKRKTSKKKAFATCMSKRLKGKKYRNRTSQKQHMARAARVCSRQIK